MPSGRCRRRCSRIGRTSPDLPQVLVISTTGDPATPYQAGVDLAKDLGAVLLTVEGTRHTAYLGAGIRALIASATTI